MLVLVPFVRGWRVVVRASRSADSTSLSLSYLSVIAQTRERNCLVAGMPNLGLGRLKGLALGAIREVDSALL